MPQNVHFHPQRPQLRAAGRASAGGRAESDSEDADVFEDAPRMVAWSMCICVGMAWGIWGLEQCTGAIKIWGSFNTLIFTTVGGQGTINAHVWVLLGWGQNIYYCWDHKCARVGTVAMGPKLLKLT